MAHQDNLLLEEQDRMTVTLSATEDRQASRIQVRQLEQELEEILVLQILSAVAADSGRYSCTATGGEAGEQTSGVMLAVFQRVQEDKSEEGEEEQEELVLEEEMEKEQEDRLEMRTKFPVFSDMNSSDYLSARLDVARSLLVSSSSAIKCKVPNTAFLLSALFLVVISSVCS